MENMVSLPKFHLISTHLHHLAAELIHIRN